MKSLYTRITALLLWVLFGYAAVAQTPITGTIISAADQVPLNGATIVVKGQNIQTISSEKGTFNINASSLPLIVTVSYAGYETKDFSITASPFTASLNSQQALDEIVVTGYSTQNKKFITSSIQ